MRMSYEEACRKAGLSEENIRKIRQVYDTDYKRLKRDQEYREKNNLVFNSLSALVSDVDGCVEYEIPDSSSDPLEKIIEKEDEAEHKRRMDILLESIKELKPDDRKLLLEYYDGKYGIESKMARERGMDRKKFIRTREEILKELKEIYFKKYNEKGDGHSDTDGRKNAGGMKKNRK